MAVGGVKSEIMKIPNPSDIMHALPGNFKSGQQLKEFEPAGREEEI